MSNHYSRKGDLYYNFISYFTIFMILIYLFYISLETHKTCMIRATPIIKYDLTKENIISIGEYNDLIDISRRIPENNFLKNECIICNVSYVNDLVKCIDIGKCNDFKKLNYPWCDRTFFRKK